MPSVTGQTMSVTLSGANVTINVSYNATFSAFERFLASNGLVFRERIQVIGQDPGVATDVVLHTFPLQAIPVPAGGGSITVPRARSLTVSRASLQEDPGLDDDEINCRVAVEAIGLPPDSVSAETAQTVLAG